MSQPGSESFKPNSNNTSIAGEFAALSQLALRGFDANLTLGNTKGVDILVSSPETGAMARLEVKTAYHNKPRNTRLFGNNVLEWMMLAKHEEIVDDLLYYDFVNIEDGTDTFRHFIVPSLVVAKYVKDQHMLYENRSGTHVPSSSNVRTFRLGLDDQQEYPIPTPLARAHENNWSQLL